METPSPLAWFFDVISPFAYIGLKQLARLAADTRVEPVPVLFAGLLQHFGQLGPAEIPSKRRFTYAFVLWRARQLGIPMRMPPAHPFNPLPALRLIIAAGSDWRAVHSVFDAVFQHGRDVSDESVLAELALGLGIEDWRAAINDPVIKQKLRDNTERACSLGVFGVPTLVVGRELFWGQDAFQMAVEYLTDPRALDGDLAAAAALPVGIMRTRKSS